MKLNVNPKEMLALYNTLHALRLNDVDLTSVSEGSDAVHLKQLYCRVRACMLNALTERPDRIESFMSREQAKIDNLTQQNVALRSVSFTPETHVDDLPENLDYPRRQNSRQSGRGRTKQ